MIFIRKIKVLEVISDTNVGGAGRLLISRIENSNRQKFEYTVILPKGSLIAEPLKNAGAKVIEINACKDKSRDLKNIFAFYKIIKNVSPDIVNSHACLTSRISAKMAGVSVNLFTRHCDFKVGKIYSVPAVKLAVKMFNTEINDGAIAVSHSAKNNLLSLGVPKKMIKVIVNGAQALKQISEDEKQKIRQNLNIPFDATVVSIFARLEVYKDHKTLLRAAKLLKLNRKIYFLIVGCGTLERELKQYARKLGLDIGLDKKVRFLGFVDDVSTIMNITDINVNCSIGTETSSLALSEGMSLGVPAIASDYSGNKYIVKNGVNGLTFPQKDHVALAQKILILSKNKALYKKLSLNAKERFHKELNAKRMTRETEKYYLSMLDMCKFKKQIRR